MPHGESRGFRLDSSTPVGFLTFDRGPANVLDIALLEALAAAVRGLSADVAVLILSGRPHFSAGVAIEDHVPEKTDAMLAAMHDFLAALLAADAVILAAVEGACLGGGAEIALCCDLVIAAEDAKIGFPEITLARFPPAAALLLPSATGPARAAELLLTGRSISGREAAESGLVSAVAKPGEAGALAGRLASGIADRSRPALRALLTLIRGPRRHAFSARRAEAEAAYRTLAAVPDLRLAVERWLESKV